MGSAGLTVVFVAVRGTTTTRITSGALIVSGTAQISGATTTGFVFAQDWFKVLFSGAAFGSPLHSYTAANPFLPSNILRPWTVVLCSSEVSDWGCQVCLRFRLPASPSV